MSFKFPRQKQMTFIGYKKLQMKTKIADEFADEMW